jgi:hypothetical protein
MNCIYCTTEIPEGRAEFLIETNRRATCLKCSVESKAVGFMNYSHKTAPDLVLCPANARETLRILDRANRRAR